MALDTDYLPVGTIIAVGRTLPVENDTFLLCNGAGLDRDNYSELFAVIGNTYGQNPERNQFLLPNCQGLFLRGADLGSGNDPDVATRYIETPNGRTFSPQPVGTIQEWATAKPGKEFSCSISLQSSTTRQHGETRKAMGEGSDKTIETCTSGGDADTRPINVYVEYYIKVRS